MKNATRVGHTLLDGEILVGVVKKGSGETARGGVRRPDMVIEIQATFVTE